MTFQLLPMYTPSSSQPPFHYPSPTVYSSKMVCRKLDRGRLGICYWFFCVVTVLSLAGVVSWLSLTPKNPHFRISAANFPALDSNNHSIHRNASVPNKALIFDLEISNPNKRMGIYYSVINLELYSGGGGVGTNSTPAFYQGYKNTTLFQILIQPRQEFWQAMNAGNVDFLIRVKTAVRFRIVKWKTKVHQVSYEEQFSRVKTNLNGTVSEASFAELQNAPKVKIRT